MSATASLPPAVNVSPLIRFGRWSLLGLGVVYGIYHQSRLSKREVALREIEAKKKVIRDAQLAKEKKAKDEAEIRELEALAGPPKA